MAATDPPGLPVGSQPYIERVFVHVSCCVAEGRISDEGITLMTSSFRVTFHDGRVEDIDGDVVEIDTASHVVIRNTLLVMGQPRSVVVRRLLGRDVADVSPTPTDP